MVYILYASSKQSLLKPRGPSDFSYFEEVLLLPLDIHGTKWLFLVPFFHRTYRIHFYDNGNERKKRKKLWIYGLRLWRVKMRGAVGKTRRNTVSESCLLNFNDCCLSSGVAVLPNTGKSIGAKGGSNISVQEIVLGWVFVKIRIKKFLFQMASAIFKHYFRLTSFQKEVFTYKRLSDLICGISRFLKSRKDKALKNIRTYYGRPLKNTPFDHWSI